MTREIVSEAEVERVKSILQSEHGVVFFPKRQVAIPTLQREYVSAIVGEKNADDAIRALDGIADYLRGVPIGDRFGPDHTGRRNWRTAMANEYGRAFRLVYLDSNQFRVNKMFNATSGIELLEMCASDNGNLKVAEKLNSIFSAWRERMGGVDPETGKQISKRYKDLEGYEDRLRVVRFSEDKFLEALSLFTPPQEIK